MDYTISQIIDRRTINKARHDFDFGYKNEREVMHGVNVWCTAHGVSCDYKKIDENEKFNDNKIHIVPDYFVEINGQKRTFEIKCSTTGKFTKRNNNEFIFVKPHAIWTMIQFPKEYPNGKLLVATSRKFSTVPVSEVQLFPLETIPEWGDKRAFVIPTERVKWNDWIIPIDV